MEPIEEFATFWEHISVLRRTLTRMLGVVVLGLLISFYFHGAIIRVLTGPLAMLSQNVSLETGPQKIDHFYISNTTSLKKTYSLPKERVAVLHISEGVESLQADEYVIPAGGTLSYGVPQAKSPQLILLGPVEGMLVAFKTSLWVGLVATSPLWLWIGFQFVSPALKRTERRLVWPFFLLSSLLIAAGIVFTYFVTIPLANSYLTAFNQEMGLNLWSLSHYLDYTLFLLLANGLAFELCAVGFLAVHVGLVSAAWLSGKRRVAILLAFILATVLTPPDVLTQLMLAVPLIIFYEVIILYARLCRR